MSINPFEPQIKITREYILSHIREEEIFHKYLEIYPNLEEAFCNPLRKGDSHPGCRFYYDSRGVLKFHDIAAKLNWDCFNVVEYSERVNFADALKIIAEDFGLIKGSRTGIARISQDNRILKPKRRIVGIRVKRKEWSRNELDWWKQYYVDKKRLDRFLVSSIEAAWFLEDDGTLRQFYYYKSSDPCYCYQLIPNDYEYKLYFPLRLRKGRYPRFIQSSSELVQGLALLPKSGVNLGITKSYKDVIVLSLFEEEFNLCSIAPQSETIVISKDIFIELYNSFDYIFTLFDFDRTGIKLARKYEEIYNLPFYFFGGIYKSQGVKDISDAIKLYGIKKTEEIIREVYGRIY